MHVPPHWWVGLLVSSVTAGPCWGHWLSGGVAQSHLDSGDSAVRHLGVSD